MSGYESNNHISAISVKRYGTDFHSRFSEIFRALFMQSPEIIFGVEGALGKMEFINSAAVSILGYSLQEVLGMNWHDLFTDDSLVRLNDRINRSIAASGGDGNSVIPIELPEIMLLAKNGTNVASDVRLALLLTSSHTVDYIYGTVHPVVMKKNGASSIGAEKNTSPASVSLSSTVEAGADKNRQGRVLIMDDEDILLDIACQMCQRLGLEVIPVKNGDDAVRTYQEAFDAGIPFDAVLLDMTISGGIGGIETAAMLQEIDSEVKNVVMSGYADHEVMVKPEKYGFIAVIPKPFRLGEFGKILESVIPAEKFVVKK